MNESRQTFRSLIASNKRKSVVLIVVFCVLVGTLSLILTLGAMAYVAPALFEGEGPLAPPSAKSKQVSHQPPQRQRAPASEGPEINWPTAIMVGIIGGALALTFSFLGYFSGDDAIMYAHRARRVFHDGDPELFNVVEEMAIAAGIPPPRIYFIHDEAPNAFATGRDPHHAAVAITSGLRLGSPAGTTRGFGQTEFRRIGKLIAEVVDGLAANGEEANGAVEARVRGEVRDLTARFPIYI